MKIDTLLKNKTKRVTKNLINTKLSPNSLQSMKKSVKI